MLQEKYFKQGYLTLSDYQSYLESLYIKANEKRAFENLYGYLDRTVAYLGKSFLKYQSGGTGPSSEEFVLPISWLFAVSTKLGLEIERPFLRKYPNICFYCLEGPCICHRTHKKPRDPSMPAYMISKFLTDAYHNLVGNSTNKFSFNKAANMVADIYTVNEIVWEFWGPWYHLAKLHEEIAEIHEAYDAVKLEGRAKQALEDEISDVLAWLLTAWKITNPFGSLDDAFIDYYINNCKLCRQFPCECNPNASLTPSLASPVLIPEIIKFFEQIRTEVPMFLQQIDHNVRSLQNSLQSQTESITKTALKQASMTLTEIDIYIDVSEYPNKLLKQDILKTKQRIEESLDDESKKEIDHIAYDVFIIYSERDYEKAQELYLFLKENNKTVFLSREEIRPGDDIEGSTKIAHSSAKAFLFLATEHSLTSEWAASEWGSAWFLEKKIVPVLYRCRVKELPDRLQRIRALDFHEKDKLLKIF